MFIRLLPHLIINDSNTLETHCGVELIGCTKGNLNRLECITDAAGHPSSGSRSGGFSIGIIVYKTYLASVSRTILRTIRE